MADLVRVRLNGIEKNVGRTFAERHDLEVLDEPTTNPDGSLRPTTRAGGRRVKPKTSVAKKAAEKKQDKAASAPAMTAEEATE